MIGNLGQFVAQITWFDISIIELVKIKYFKCDADYSISLKDIEDFPGPVSTLLILKVQFGTF